jgi:hypothetical protein
MHSMRRRDEWFSLRCNARAPLMHINNGTGKRRSQLTARRRRRLSVAGNELSGNQLWRASGNHACDASMMVSTRTTHVALRHNAPELSMGSLFPSRRAARGASSRAVQGIAAYHTSNCSKLNTAMATMCGVSGRKGSLALCDPDPNRTLRLLLRHHCPALRPASRWHTSQTRSFVRSHANSLLSMGWSKIAGAWTQAPGVQTNANGPNLLDWPVQLLLFHSTLTGPDSSVVMMTIAFQVKCDSACAQLSGVFVLAVSVSDSKVSDGPLNSPHETGAPVHTGQSSPYKSASNYLRAARIAGREFQLLDGSMRRHAQTPCSRPSRFAQGWSSR